jgi:hypothetical protein
MSTTFIFMRCFLYDTDFTNLRTSVTALEAQVTLSFPLIIDTERFALTIHQLQDNRHPVLTFSYRRLFPTNCTYENRHNLVNSCGPRHTAFSIKSRILRPDNASLPYSHSLSTSQIPPAHYSTPRLRRLAPSSSLTNSHTQELVVIACSATQSISASPSLRRCT